MYAACSHVAILCHTCLIAQDKSLHVLFDVMTENWGQDPPSMEEPGDDEIDEPCSSDAYPEACQEEDQPDEELAGMQEQIRILKRLGLPYTGHSSQDCCMHCFLPVSLTQIRNHLEDLRQRRLSGDMAAIH